MNKLRILCLIIASVLVFGFSGCKKSPEKVEEGNKTDKIWSVPSTAKVMLDEKPTIYNEPDLTINMVRNEVESIQLMLTPCENTYYDVEVGDLKNGESVIRKDNIIIYREHYIKVDVALNADFKEGFYPDALIPIDISKRAGENKISKGQNQGIFISVKAPKDAKPGRYEGNIIVTMNGRKSNIPLHVNLSSVTLPDSTTAKTAFALWQDCYVHAYGKCTPEIVDNHYEFMLDYRITPTYFPNTGDGENPTVQEFVEQVKKYALRSDVTCYSLPCWGVRKSYKGKTYIGMDIEKYEKCLIELAKISTNEKNYLSKAYMYFVYVDEVSSRLDLKWKARVVDKEFYQIRKDVCENKIFNDGKKDEVKQSIYNLQHVITGPLFEDLLPTDEYGNYIGGVNTACPYFSWADNKEYMELQNSRVALGEKWWWYGCTGPVKPYPTYHIDDGLMSSRGLLWMQKYYGVQGNLYWCANNWNKYDVSNYPSRDVWTDAKCFPDLCGDGFLIYPGKKYGLNSPLPSIRLENIRDGQEDYELLVILENELNKANARYNTKITLNDYLNYHFKNLFSGAVFDQNHNKFDLARKEVVKLIELLQSDANAIIQIEEPQVNNKIKINIYAEVGTDVIIDNKKIAMTSCENGVMGSYECYLHGGRNDCKMTIKNKSEYSFNKYIGQGVKLLSDFNTESEINKWSKTDGGKTIAGITQVANDIKLSFNGNSAYSTFGGSMKATFKYAEKTAYQPAIILKLSGKEKDLSNVERFKIDVFNNSVNGEKIRLKIFDESGRAYEVYHDFAKAGMMNHLDIKIRDLQNIDIKNIKEIRLVIDLPEQDEKVELYFDNFVMVSKWQEAI